MGMFTLVPTYVHTYIYIYIICIQAGKSVGEIVRTTLGPNSMLKMILDPMGGICLTNDGNAILREIDVAHPAAKSIIELSRAQDEEVGDGTTSVVVLAGELLCMSEPLLTVSKLHPTTIVQGYRKGLKECLKALDECSVPVDIDDPEKVREVVAACVGTKFSSNWNDIVCRLAIDAAKCVCVVRPDGKKEVDVKRYARIEKIPGGLLEESTVLNGIVINKDVTHPNMRRNIKDPRVILLDCPLEYKKGESQTNVEVMHDADWEKLLKQEEEEVRKMCADIISIGCDIVLTEKGVSDLAQHFLSKANISVIRRVRKTDNNRIAKVTGATIVNRTEELCDADVGTECHTFKVEKIGDEYFAYFVDCENPKACTVVLRGASKDVLNEVERNWHDAVSVARNVLLESRLLPGGGAAEMWMATRLKQLAAGAEGVEIWAFQALADAFEVIPRTLAENCGCQVVRTLTELRAKHAQGEKFVGIDGETGEVCDVSKRGIWDTYAVKAQVCKTAIQAASMLLRIDDILSGITKKKDMAPDTRQAPADGAGDQETFGDARDG
eukprot:GHVU01216632.1.p1 GENE.GHVU01216632.1~~GHVU01216632.1.p1  ORF type:complete len:553 (+),score=146.37 GHVU01216632.1:1049-2707(+)